MSQHICHHPRRRLRRERALKRRRKDVKDLQECKGPRHLASPSAQRRTRMNLTDEQVSTKLHRALTDVANLEAKLGG